MIPGRIHGPIREAVAGGVGSVVHIKRRAIGFHVQHAVAASDGIEARVGA